MPINRRIRPDGAVAPGATAAARPNGGAMPVSATAAAKGWSPTVANLMILIVLEMVAFSVIRYVFKRVSD